MAKGPEKNTKNKALHTKLLNRKKAKLQEEKRETAMNSDNLQDVINSNISVINLMREEGVNDDLIHEDALTSYYLDYYYSQYVTGNFAQFVHQSGWNTELNELIEEGLAL